ncbi:MAG: dihydrofolate reductase family protein [Anaerolineae bacterium]
MRKIFLLMNVSLDGFFEASEHDISGFKSDFEAFSAGAGGEVDGLLFGHRTYEMMKFWRTPEAQQMAPQIAAFMNATPKYVASHQPFDPEWDNVTVLSGDVIEAVQQLKASSGSTIGIFGSNQLCVSLMQHKLIDEFQIIVNPVVFGAGTALFTGLPQKTELTLKTSRQFQSGAVMLIYHP